MTWKIVLGSALLIATTGLGLFAAIKYIKQRESARRSEHGLVLASPASAPRLPLQIVAGQPYLSDAAGRPFLLHGDTAWSLVADATREEADLYLTDRRARGFNTLIVNLLERRFARRAPANIYGDLPFIGAENFLHPNEAYFSHADWVLERARELGLVVLLAPSYAGYDGKEEGWWQEMTAAGSVALRDYGRFLGRRYGHLDNIVWLEGGDYDPPDAELVRAIAMGIKETAPRQLHTVHPGPETSVLEFWKDDSAWIDLIPVYTYRSVCDGVSGAVAASGGKPVFLLESSYENEHGADAKRVRMQAYSALLCGASGEIYGNNPIWHFSHPGLMPSKDDWWTSLGSRGAQSMTHLRNLFQTFDWWKLRPDTQGAFLLSHSQEASAYAALAVDGTLGLVYASGQQKINLDLSSFASDSIVAEWFDPSSGSRTDFKGAPLKRERRSLTLPGRNAADDDDWILVLTVPSR